jgi:hypothetical protein
LQRAFLDDLTGPRALQQCFLAAHGSARVHQSHQHVESASAELNGLAVHQQLSAVRQEEKAPERKALYFGGRIHRLASSPVDFGRAH